MTRLLVAFILGLALLLPLPLAAQTSSLRGTVTDAQGALIPGVAISLTNLDTGKSITLVASGLFQAKLKRDGSGVVQVTGHGPFLSHPVTGEAGIWYLSGRLIAVLDADGNPTSVHSTGKLVNLCPQLAG